MLEDGEIIMSENGAGQIPAEASNDKFREIWSNNFLNDRVWC